MLLHALPLLALASAPCKQDPPASAPERVFEELWRVFDRTYPMFEVEDLQWDALHDLYRPRVGAGTSDEELFEILAEMLGHLDDNHVMLQAPDGHPDVNLITGDLSAWDGERRRNRENAGFSAELIDDAYVLGALESRVGGTFRFGRLSERVGYLQLTAFDLPAPTAAAMDEFLEQADEYDALVVDLRANGGGGNEAVVEILGRFTDRPRVFGYRRMRRSKGPASFSEPLPLVVEPTGDTPFTRPVLVLTGPFSMSAADTFALGASTLPTAVLIGQPTSGSFSTILGLRLSNGWLFSLPYELVTDHRGRCWEGIGVQPDLYVENTPADVVAGRDRALELAVALSEHDLEPGEDDPATHAVPASLARALGGWLDEPGDPEAAVARLRSARGDGYLAAEELWDLACDRLAKGKREQVLALLAVLFEDLAGEWMFAVPDRDWYVLLEANDAEITRSIFEHAAGLDPDFPLGGRLRARALAAR